ncbi:MULTISPECIES: SxtJ family membrane protein [unclassified Sinorhizobium]|uniref:SxtJ family membrane protein n=1 Tax=unclassified Sinorhizobium TaxID=2613772 RepID=UPI0024C42743|nr:MULTISPECIES: SxtJ family membrane protein [unclassified Sinorhizobium]MDK1378435.1 SxtJ family membrane protein [Sinorhizobium sp. 6-70]MDK1482128.1 SxtJ family membrane protein [Sinorhizobium sp. 6-117]
MSASHEPIIESIPEGPSNRSFGYTVGGILFCIAVLRWWQAEHATPLTIALGSIGIALVILAYLAPDTLTTANRLWTKLGFLLFKVINPVVMLLIYVTTFIPIGVLLRLRGHDPLGTAFDRSASTYWKARSANEPPPATMRNQY